MVISATLFGIGHGDSAILFGFGQVDSAIPFGFGHGDSAILFGFGRGDSILFGFGRCRAEKEERWSQKFFCRVKNEKGFVRIVVVKKVESV